MKNKLKILIVEDSEIIRESLQKVISSLIGAEIIGFAYNSLDAIDQYLKFKPDVIILDLMLNWSTGIEVMKLIREHRNESSIVILYSNITNPFIRNHCRAVGADYCLDKSNDLDQLIIICQKLISKRFPNLIPFETNYFIPKLEYVKCSGSERLRNYLTTAIGMKFLII